jgi:hypothetical protein
MTITLPEQFIATQVPDFGDVKREYTNSAAWNDALYMHFEAI